jgi:AcrR family transcriptional regulator
MNMAQNRQGIHRAAPLMTMSQLSNRSGVPISTIKYYFRENLLPRGVKTNRTTVYYGPNHINQLKMIKKLQEEGLTLRRIKSFIKNQDTTGNGPISSEPDTPSVRRENIIEAAIPLFLDKGLEKTSITDIVKDSHISRNTFYREFKSKREVFVSCLGNIFQEMIDTFNEDVRKKLASQKNGPDTSWGFLGVRSSWTDFMNLLGATIVNDPRLLDKMLDDHIELRAREISNGLDIYLEKGLIRAVDTQVLGLLILGIIDYSSRYLRNGKFKNADMMFKNINDILMNGISPAPK